MPENVANKNFCFILKKLREEKGLSINKLAKQTGINRNTISRYETTPNITPKSEYVKILANYFGVSESYIRGETEATNIDDIEISRELGINYKTIQNLREIKEINSKFENKYNDLLSDVLTNPSLYSSLVKETSILLNNDLKEKGNNQIKENAKRIIGKSTMQYEDYSDIIICHKFLEYYNMYITFRNPINLTKAELIEKQTELKKQLRIIETRLKTYK